MCPCLASYHFVVSLGAFVWSEATNGFSVLKLNSIVLDATLGCIIISINVCSVDRSLSR